MNASRRRPRTPIPQLEAHGNSGYSRSVLPSAVVSLSLDSWDRMVTPCGCQPGALASSFGGNKHTGSESCDLASFSMSSKLSSRPEFISPCLRHAFTRPASFSFSRVYLVPKKFSKKYSVTITLNFTIRAWSIKCRRKKN